MVEWNLKKNQFFSVSKHLKNLVFEKHIYYLLEFTWISMGEIIKYFQNFN
jgi:hypothetical protein